MSDAGGATPLEPRLVGHWVAERARLHPERLALVGAEQRYTYRDLDDLSSAAARGLVARGVAPGDRVAVLSENHPDVVVLLFACAKAGAILFPMNWRLANAELAAQLELLTPRLWVASEAQRARLDASLTDGRGVPDRLEWALSELAVAGDGAALPEVRPDAGLAVIATSGTTGRPKGVLLTHANFFWTNLSLDFVVPILDSDVVLQVLPQFHIGGWNVQPMQALLKGATLLVESSFDAGRVLDLVERERVTTMAGVPTTYLMLSEHPRFEAADLTSLRSVVVGGAAMPATLAERWRARGVAVFQGYGLTEAGPNVFCLAARDAADHPCSVGHPYPFVEVALVDPESHAVLEGAGSGELYVRGPGIFPGYWRDADATSSVLADGWLRTGDIVSRDADGFYSIAGRAKEMFISGGENVYPVEVENVLTSFPGVLSAAVVSVDHSRWGETGVAYLEATPGATVDLDALEAHCRVRLAGYKVPTRFVLVDELPRTPVGKIDKRLLRERAASGATA